MKKLKTLFACLILIALTLLPSSDINAGKRPGTPYSYDLYNADGSHFGTIIVSPCDSCSWFIDLFGCNCQNAQTCDGPC
jgi:hypothetical protein